MSVEAMTWAFQVRLKPCPKSVLVALANRADEDGYCWPGIGDLQLRTGWGVRSIQAALHELEGAGLLRISPRFLASGTQTSNLYQLVMTTISSGEGAGRAGGGCRTCGGRVQVVHLNLHLNNHLNNQVNNPPYPPRGARCVYWMLV